MSFDWIDYVILSEELLLIEEESCLRSSISRAYYGVFGIIRGKIKFIKNTGTSVHINLINELKFSTSKIQRKLGKDLDEFRRARNKADYDSKYKIEKEYAERWIILARAMLNSIKVI